MDRVTPHMKTHQVNTRLVRRLILVCTGSHNVLVTDFIEGCRIIRIEISIIKILYKIEVHEFIIFHYINKELLTSEGPFMLCASTKEVNN